MADPVLAELERERFGDFRDVKRERYAQPLDPPVDGPRDWVRRQAVLLDTLENIPQDYRRGFHRPPTGRSQACRVIEWAAAPPHAGAGEIREAAR